MCNTGNPLAAAVLNPPAAPPGFWPNRLYDADTAHAKGVLGNLKKSYPDYKGPGCEVAGFGWWQGHCGLATGCGNPGAEGFGKKIAEAQIAVGDAKKHPEFKGNVTVIHTRDRWREAADSPVNQGYHYNHNVETCMKTGPRLGRAMADLLKGEMK